MLSRVQKAPFIRERLGVLELATDLVMEKGNFVLGFVVGSKKLGGLKFQGLEKVVGGFFQPFQNH